MVKVVYAEASGTYLPDCPPIRVWKELRPNSVEPKRVEVLKVKNEKKSAVYRLCGAGPEGMDVIAKRSRAETAHIERFVYEEVLPVIGQVSALRFFGFVEDPVNKKYCWLFLEDAAGLAYSPLDEAHRALAGQWLGEIELASLPAEIHGRLPNRGPAYYLKSLRYCQVMLQGHRAYNPALSIDLAEVFERIVRRLDALESRWGRVEEICEAMPQTLVHGDFVIRNLGVRPDASGSTLRVFDWEHAGWGVPGTDLAQFTHRGARPDLNTYHSILKRAYSHLTFEDIQRVAACGKVFRMIDEVRWTLPTLEFGSRDPLLKAVSMLQTFENPLAEALHEVERAGRQ